MKKKRWSLAAIFDKVSDIIAEKNNIEKNEIELESHLINDLSFDSLDTAEILMEIEKEFGINFNKGIYSAELNDVRIVENLVNLIYKMAN